MPKPIATIAAIASALTVIILTGGCAGNEDG